MSDPSRTGDTAPASESASPSARAGPRLSLRTVKDAGATGSLARLSVALATAVSLAALAAVSLSARPASALRAFFVMPFASQAAFLSMLEAAAPLALCALGVLVAFRAGHFSLGGEGQAYAGSFAAAALGGLVAQGSGPAAIAAAMLAGALAGAAVAALPAAGSRFSGSDVLLSSLLVSQGFIYVIDWAIAGPLRDPAGNLIAMRPIPESMLLPRLAPPSTLTAAPVIVLALCLAASFYFDRSRSGAAHDLYGRNRCFAALQGYDVRLLAWAPVVIAGALHGMAGAAVALGARGTALRGMSGGIGWSAIGVALIAASRPSALPLAALLFAWLDAGARQASVLAELPPDSGMAVKALVILVVGMRPALKELGRRRGPDARSWLGRREAAS